MVRFVCSIPVSRALRPLVPSFAISVLHPLVPWRASASAVQETAGIHAVELPLIIACFQHSPDSRAAAFVANA
jgi:hypothetical protein